MWSCELDFSEVLAKMKVVVHVVRPIPVKIVPFEDNRPGISWNMPMPLCSSWKLVNWGVPGMWTLSLHNEFPFLFSLRSTWLPQQFRWSAILGHMHLLDILISLIPQMNMAWWWISLGCGLCYGTNSIAAHEVVGSNPLVVFISNLFFLAFVLMIRAWGILAHFIHFMFFHNLCLMLVSVTSVHNSNVFFLAFF